METATFETITPEEAKALLATNIETNRKLSPARVNAYANDMRNDRWLQAADTIRISSEGKLIDGQHRLASVVQADTPVRFLVVRGVDPKVFPVIDSGQSRTVAQSMGGVPHACAKAAAIRLFFVHEIGLDPRSSPAMQMVNRLDITATYSLVADEIVEPCRSAWWLYHNVGGSLSAWMAFILLANRVNHRWADEFTTSIRTGANLSDGDPRLALRNRMINKARKMTNSEALGLMIKAWNQWLCGEQRSVAKFSETEPWPQMSTKRTVESRRLFAVPKAA